MFSHKHSFRFYLVLFGLGLIIAPSLVSVIMSNNIYAATYEASISTSGSITLDVSAAGNGASVTTDELTIVSTCPEGYEVFIQGPADSTLYKDGNSSNTEATKKINPSAGTKDTPRGIIGTDSATNTSNMNTWGYSIGDVDTSTTPATITPATIRSTSFIGLTNNLVSLTTKNSASSNTGDKLPVYYGVSVDTGIEPGVYTMEGRDDPDGGKITYSLVTNINCMTYQVAFNPTATMYDIDGSPTTVSGTGTMANQRISEGIATNLAANTFTAPEGYTFDGWNTAQNGTGTTYADKQSVMDLTTPGNTITLYAQWKEKSTCTLVPNRICYNDNGANSPTQMGPQDVDPSATEVTLWASNFQRPGYGFAGWSIDPDQLACTLDEDPRTGELICLTPYNSMFGPNETIAITNTHNDPGALYIQDGITLYAIWVEPAKDANGNALSFQTPNLLTTRLDNGFALTDLPTGYVTALKDERDNQVYAVAKLEDGNYWMIENLRLDNTNSDNSTGALAQGYGTGTTYGNFSGLAEPETSQFSESTCENSLYWTGGAVCDIYGVLHPSIIIGTNDDPSYRMPRFNNQNTASPATTVTEPDNDTYGYGNYYTWPAAVADTSYHDILQEAVDTSICPTGWELPTGETGVMLENDFYNLTFALAGEVPNNPNSGFSYYDGTLGVNTSRRLRAYPNNFIYSGIFLDSSPYSRGFGGVYWSNSVDSYNSSYSFGFSDDEVFPGSNPLRKSTGANVRCIAGS